MYIDLTIPLPQDHVQLNRVFLSSNLSYFTSLYRVFKKVRLASHFQIASEIILAEIKLISHKKLNFEANVQ